MESKSIGDLEAKGNNTAVFPNIESRLQKDEIILHTAFNQDQDAFAIGTTKGFAVFSVEPFKFRYLRQIVGGVKLV